MIATEHIEVRNLERGERIPVELYGGFPLEWNFDCDWSWVALVDGVIRGYILAGTVQGVVMIMVIKAEDKHTVVLPRLLRTFLRDCLSRGYTGWMVHLNHEKPEQGKLMRIAKKAGAIIFPFKIVCVGGRIEDAARW
jgi:hypothetical protein